MTALSADQLVDVFLANADPEGRKVNYQVAASTVIYKGGVVALNAAGYLVMWTPEDGDTVTADTNRIVGIAMDAVASQTAAGDARCEVLVEGTIEYALSGAVIADTGAPVFISDNSTLTKVGTNQFFGYIENFVSSGIVTVNFDFRRGNSHPLLTRVTGSIETDAANIHQIFHKTENHNGLWILMAYALVTEVSAGDTEDQGIITLQDTAGTTCGITFTPTNGAADTVGDIILGVGCPTETAAATGAAQVIVPADLGLDAKVTQLTSGTSEAGAMKIVVVAVPIA